MLNKTRIEWCDFTWNPVTGCRHGCPYCYARKIASRFGGASETHSNETVGEECQWATEETGEIHDLEEQIFDYDRSQNAPYPYYFEPTLHRYRLDEPQKKKKPSKIFVCSMADLFGAWVPDSWIEGVFKACDAAPGHTYMFLTKNPRRYMELAEKGIIRTADNFWYGSTATTPETEFFWHDQLNTFVSIEPILVPFPDVAHPDCGIQKVKWVIIGAETGNHKGKVVPERDWIRDIVKACRATKTPVFLKDSLENIWGEDLIQEWPEGMPMDRSDDVPHCRECEHVKMMQEGKRGNRHECQLVGKHIPGRYARISPLWCPRREEGDHDK